MREAVIACAVMKMELEAVAGSGTADLYFLEQGLHRTPQLMPQRLQAKIDELAPLNYDRFALGYGLCSNGVLGVGGRSAALVMPRCHDCISLFLGSVRRYNELFRRRPGTYYFTAGWIAEEEDPLSCVERRYAPRMGLKKAKRAMDLELANYTHFCYIDNGLGDQAALRAKTRENCLAFEKDYMEVKGDLGYFQALINQGRPGDGTAFIALKPEETLNEALFYQPGSPGLF